MPDVITATEYLEIASTPLATPAWRITDLTPLFAGAALRGAPNRLLPLAGARALPQRVGPTTYSLPITIWGHRNRDGSTNADARAGLKANIAALHTAFIDPPTPPATTRSAIWHQAGGTTVTKDINAVTFTPTAFSPRAIRGVLSFTVTTGRFT